MLFFVVALEVEIISESHVLTKDTNEQISMIMTMMEVTLQVW